MNPIIVKVLSDVESVKFVHDMIILKGFMLVFMIVIFIFLYFKDDIYEFIEKCRKINS